MPGASIRLGFSLFLIKIFLEKKDIILNDIKLYFLVLNFC